MKEEQPWKIISEVAFLKEDYDIINKIQERKEVIVNGKCC